jgi:hypothetical protein
MHTRDWTQFLGSDWLCLLDRFAGSLAGLTVSLQDGEAGLKPSRAWLARVPARAVFGEGAE